MVHLVSYLNSRGRPLKVEDPSIIIEYNTPYANAADHISQEIRYQLWSIIIKTLGEPNFGLWISRKFMRNFMIEFVSIAVTIAKFVACAQSEMVTPIGIGEDNKVQQIVLKIPIRDTLHDDYLSAINPSSLLFVLYSISKAYCFVNNRMHQIAA